MMLGNLLKEQAVGIHRKTLDTSDCHDQIVLNLNFVVQESLYTTDLAPYSEWEGGSCRVLALIKHVCGNRVITDEERGDHEIKAKEFSSEEVLEDRYLKEYDELFKVVMGDRDIPLYNQSENVVKRKLECIGINTESSFTLDKKIDFEDHLAEYMNNKRMLGDEEVIVHNLIELDLEIMEGKAKQDDETPGKIVTGVMKDDKGPKDTIEEQSTEIGGFEKGNEKTIDGNSPHRNGETVEDKLSQERRMEKDLSSSQDKNLQGRIEVKHTKGSTLEDIIAR